MTFVNLSLLAGTALIAVPIVLHLIMRRKPTLLEFPALRFIQKRHDMNRRRLRLRHLLLLLLRAGAIALLAFALARPSVKFGAAVGQPGGAGGRGAGVRRRPAHGISPREPDPAGGRPRARPVALGAIARAERDRRGRHAARLGGGVSARSRRGQGADRAAGDAWPIRSRCPTAIDAAVKLLAAEHAWIARKSTSSPISPAAPGPRSRPPGSSSNSAELGGVGIYVIDVGVAKPTDYGLGEVRLSGEVLSNRSTLDGRDRSFRASAPPAPRTVELHLLDADGKPQKRGEQSVEATPGELRPVEFHVGGLEPGTHQGFVRIVGQDGLAADDTRYFTVEVKPAWRVLVAAPKPAAKLRPVPHRGVGAGRAFANAARRGSIATSATWPSLPKRPLADYAAVCLLDPTPLEPATWQKLADFAAEGHGVAIFLGRNASPVDSFNEPQAQALLPGKLLRQARRPDGDLHLAPRDYQHPILAAFRGQAGSIPWDAFPVFRYWELDELSKGVGVVRAVQRRQAGAAGAARRPGTRADDDHARLRSAQSRPVEPAAGGRLGVEPWPFMILANQMAAYLVGSSDQQLNYLAGQTAVLRLDAAQQRRSYLLFTPDGHSFLVHGRSESPRVADHDDRSGGQLPAPGGRQPAAWTSASASTTPPTRRGSIGSATRSLPACSAR